MVGQADVPDGAGRHQPGDRLDADFDGDPWVWIVQLQHVDVFDTETTKALHEVGANRWWRAVRRPRVVGATHSSALGEDRHVVAPAADRLTDDAFGLPPSVERGRIDPRDARVQGSPYCRH